MRQLAVLLSAEGIDDLIQPYSDKTLFTQGQIFVPDLAPIPFSNAKTLLGQEFPFAIYNMQAENGICFNLEAFAIVAGTIQRGGILYLLCPKWNSLTEQIDFDTLRWNNAQAIATPNFYRWFQDLFRAFHFKIIPHISELPPNAKCSKDTDIQLATQKNTHQQQIIFEKLPLDPAKVHLITAPRGRGKSTLSGKLAEKLSQQQAVLITARSHSALPNFWKGIENTKVTFFAPDRLIQAIEQQSISPNQWIFIDEAASLPLPMLKKLCHYFDKVVLTTTTHNYEGTGRGFSLKFLPQLNRSYQQWQLTKPLRWAENDPLEQFICQLLLLDDVPMPSLSLSSSIQTKIDFYYLLANAHYKTTPTDLRRLFDANDQQFYSLIINQKIIAGCWAIKEGGLDHALTQAIWRGERRPQGNLVAQYLCFQGNLPDACLLHSLRISRIAVQPEFQQQGYGKRLVSQIILQISPLVDFLSVSFGMSDELLHFWQSCGFQLVQITPTAEASSGLQSAMMIYPLLEQGKQFCQQAKQQFERDYALMTGNINESNRELLDYDWQNLKGFINAKRSFSSCIASLKRLYLRYPTELAELTPIFSQINADLPAYKKIWLDNLRQKIQSLQICE